uniref:Uncharacterized protein n=1 Tax=Syphacia muris TaxID=451379 RepID=A0A0N5AKE4_9BILA
MSFSTYRSSYGFGDQLFTSKKALDLSWSSVALRRLCMKHFLFLMFTRCEANNKTASTSESQLNNNTTVSKPQTAAATIIDVVPATKVDNTRSFGIVEEENTGDNVASNSASSPDKFNSQDGQRKSLSSKFFESRSQFSTVGNESDKKPLEHIARRPKPYGDDATEIYEKSATDFATGSLLNEQTEESNTEASKTDLTTDIRTGNVSSLLEKFSKQIFQSFTAGDGNPVRHSLINLVMEEDVPLLMEAMAEKLNFEFEDLSTLPSSSTEGIIRTSQQRKKQRNASRIGFSDSPPAVFSYPDESTATEFSEWHPGEDISFEEYQKICEEERQKYEDERLTNKWQTPFNANEMSQIFSVSEQPTVGDFALGVTSRISYSTSPPYNPNNAFATNTNM